MYPRTYFETWFRYQANDEVFVALPFTETFTKAFQQVIEPAITGVLINGKPLRARVVNRGTVGAPDIHERIYDGILHCRFFIADMTVQASADVGGRTHRQPNANVAYEVGLAAAWRNPEDLLLIHQPRPEHRYSFDVQNLRHHEYDPKNPKDAALALRSEIIAALQGSQFLATEAYRKLLLGLSPTAVAFMYREAPYRAFPAISMDIGKQAPLRSHLEEAIDELVRFGALKARQILPPDRTSDGRLTFVYEWTDLGLRLLQDWKAITVERQEELRAQIKSVPADRLPPRELTVLPDPLPIPGRRVPEAPPSSDTTPPEAQKDIVEIRRGPAGGGSLGQDVATGEVKVMPPREIP